MRFRGQLWPGSASLSNVEGSEAEGRAVSLSNGEVERWGTGSQVRFLVLQSVDFRNKIMSSGLPRRVSRHNAQESRRGSCRKCPEHNSPGHRPSFRNLRRWLADPRLRTLAARA